MDSLSFAFLAYAAFCLARATLARATLARRPPSGGSLALLSGVLMMALDVVIDPLAVRGDRWFLDQIFYYPEGGVYFGVPLSNFTGWVVVGTTGVGLYLAAARTVGAAPANRPRGRAGLVWPGIALYYAVLGFNLAMTIWIGEWLLAGLGGLLHAAVARALRFVHRHAVPGEVPGAGSRGLQRI
jgi:putative membrane protein